MKKISLSFFAILFFIAFTTSLVYAQNSATVKISDDRKQLRIFLNTAKPLDPKTRETVLKVKKNYRLFEIMNADDPELMKGVRLDIVDGEPDLPDNSYLVTLNLSRMLDYGSTYMLKIDNLTFPVENDSTKPPKPLPTVSFVLGKELVISPSIEGTRGKIRVQSTSQMLASERIVVKDTIFKISKDNSELIEKTKEINATVINEDVEDGEKIKSDDLDIKLDKKLREGTKHQLEIKEGIADGSGTNIEAKGKVSVPGKASAPSGSPIEISLLGTAAKKENPAFDVDSKIALPETRFGKSTDWYFQPNIEVKLGFGVSKTEKSITIFSPFINPFFKEYFTGKPRPRSTPLTTPPILQDRNSGTGNNVTATAPAKKLIPEYEAWSNAPWHELDSVEFKGGPKIEIDQDFKRFNLLGTARLEFKFTRWLRSISEKKDKLEADLLTAGVEKEQVSIRSGYRLIPFLMFDAGGKVSGEVIENDAKTARVVIPRNGILRATAGFSNVYELPLWWMPITFTIEQNLVYLGITEQVGSQIDGEIDIRKVRGFHPQGKAILDFALDPSKKYSLSITYQNGRWAPNFEYLNTVKVGVKLVY